jgi:hypothetical protein
VLTWLGPGILRRVRHLPGSEGTRLRWLIRRLPAVVAKPGGRGSVGEPRLPRPFGVPAGRGAVGEPARRRAVREPPLRGGGITKTVLGGAVVPRRRWQLETALRRAELV